MPEKHSIHLSAEPFQESHAQTTGQMGSRGTSRPMDDTSPTMPKNQHDGKHHGHPMSRDDRLKMLKKHHASTLWVHWTLVMLGIWTALSPFTFGYTDPAQWVDPSGGRGAWFSEAPLTELRASLMLWSDVIAGLLLTIFGWRTLRPNRPLSMWTCCGIGMWMTFAPVLLWYPSAAAFLNDTLVGAFVITLSILIPGMPNMIMYMQMGPPTPPGWSYNPSSWPQRWIMIATGFAGWLVSRYLAAFQLGYINYVWDPFFGFKSGTERVLNSDMSHMWPVSDAGFGAIAYTFEFLMGFMGGPSRWRTMPWMVAFFGILVIPLGLTHIILVISQPVVVGHWCTMCLLAAAIMLPMIPLEFDEVFAMGQHLVEARKRGDRGGSLWQVFWHGGSADDSEPDQRTPPLQEFSSRPWEVFKSSFWGVSSPLALVVSSAIGVVMMFVPSLAGWDVASAAAHIGHLCGALIVTTSVIAMAEIVRPLRFVNVPLGLIAAIGIWLTREGDIYGGTLLTVGGLAVCLFALPRGTKREDYGLWERFIR